MAKNVDRPGLPFQCILPPKDNPATPGFVNSQEEWLQLRSQLPPEHGPQWGDLRRFERKVFVNGDLTMPDGVVIRHWGFEDGNGARTLPSPAIRVSGGDLVQVTMSAAKRQHTIHHHGIEPDAFNDGVGHTSFEVTGDYTYQWRAHPANAGTFFYHCHVNTTLHVQMGLWGALIIDPPGTDPNAAPPKKPFREAPDWMTYDVEAIWATSAIDPRWHELNHAAGMCGEDVGLNRFEPKYFLINGSPQDPNGPPIEKESVKATAGQTILIRTINATYFPVEIDFGALDVEVIESDGRPIRSARRPDLTGLAGGDITSVKLSDHTQRTGPAERWGFLIRDVAPGVYPVELRYRHWITREVAGVARTTVTVQ